MPSSLPDLLKTEAVIRFEYERQDSRLPNVRIREAERRLAYSRRPENDMEVCSSIQSVESFARGEGIWRQLPAEVRRAQLDWMIRALGELYPTLRWFLFDGLKRFCVPLTVFGPLRAAVYIGDPKAGTIGVALQAAVGRRVRLILPVGGAGHQELTVIERREGRLCERHLGGCVFVKLIGKEGW